MLEIENGKQFFYVNNKIIFGDCCGKAERAPDQESKQLLSSNGSGRLCWTPLGGSFTALSCFPFCERMRGYLNSLPDLIF